jgi:hypothetical protein
LFEFQEICLKLWTYCQQKKVKMVIILLAGVCLIIFTVECWLNFKVRSYLRESLGWGSGPQVKITAHINWLSLVDVMNGQVGWVRIDGENCLISNLRFARLHLENQGFTFNLPALFKEKRLKLVHLNKTRINAIVTAPAFSDYLSLYYPQFKPTLKINPGMLVLRGQTSIFGNIVPVELAGLLKIVALKNLRFYPTRLFIAKRAVSHDFLRFVGNQLPLQFSLMAEWPLAITAVRLKEGYIAMGFKEINPAQGDSQNIKN